jgi:hypothetical protein
MVAVVPTLLSDQPPEVPQRAGLGDRFHYFRGFSGRRYLFSAIDREDLADFRSAVVMVARPAADGHLSADWIAVLDQFGRPIGERRVPPIGDTAVVLVHCLTMSASGRFDLLADLADSAPAALAA